MLCNIGEIDLAEKKKAARKKKEMSNVHYWTPVLFD